VTPDRFGADPEKLAEVVRILANHETETYEDRVDDDAESPGDPPPPTPADDPGDAAVGHDDDPGDGGVTPQR
jgi:hypothetical protein